MLLNKKVKWYLLIIITFACFLIISEAAGQSNKLKIMVINWRVEKVASQGLKDGLKELGYDVEYEEFIAHQQDQSLSNFLKSGFDPKLYDYIYTFSTSASILTHHMLQGVTPQIFSVVSFPVKSRLVKSLDRPGVNCTGVTHYVPVELQIKTAMNFLKFRSLLMLFNPNEQNSNITRIEIDKLSRSYQFRFESIRTYSETTMKEALRKIRTGEIKSDIVYLPSDSMITTHIETIVKELKDIKQFHFSALKRDVDKGALFGIANDYYKVGKAAAVLIDQNQKGTPIQNIPVKRFDDPTIFVNRETSILLNCTIPEKLVDQIKFIDE